MKTTILYESTQAAYDAAYMLRGDWDGLNGVTVEQLDIAALNFVANQMRSDYCIAGTNWFLPITVETLLSLYANGLREFQKSDLSCINLSGVSLVGINLKNSNLSQANLKKTNLAYANLQGATLVDANLEGTQVGDAARLAEYCAYPRAEIAAALATKYALKLGADSKAQVEILRELVGNPYLLAIAPKPSQYWWQHKPKPRNPVEFLFHRLNAWVNLEVNQRIEFYNFLSEHSNLAEAWDYCQNPGWMLAMLDLYSNYANTLEGQIKLRQFACWCVTEQRFFQSEDLDERIKIAVQIAEQFTIGLATQKDLKEAEIRVSQAYEDIGNFRLVSVGEIALFCTHQSAWISALGVIWCMNFGQALQPLQALKLRELIGNPFDF